jgi:DNA-binding XRE family transcriptional regulator
MAKKFRDLIASKSPEWQAAVKARTRQMLAELPLHELRRARELSQEELAQVLGATQPEISKIEHRADMYVSTLRRYIEAMGGRLEITAHFRDGAVRITQFHEVESTEVAR